MGVNLQQIVDELQREVEALRAENARLRAQLEAAQQRISELERAAARQAAPFRRAESKKVPDVQKKRPGQKPGHSGAFRRRPPQIDQEIDVPLDACPHCGGPVTDRLPLDQIIEEIPPLRPQVIRLTTYSGQCSQCGEVRSTHPLQTSLAQGAAGVHLGPRALALAVLLNKQLGNTMGSTCRILRDVCGLSITRGGLAQALARVADKVESEYQVLLQRLRASDAVFADETSWWVGGPGWWLWVFTTPDTTVYRVDQSRGSQVVLESLGEHFPGMLVSDCLSSYDPPPYRKHKCIAHHLRAIHQARDQPSCQHSVYLRQWELFFAVVQLVWRERTNWSPEFFVARRAGLEAWCDQLLAQPCAQAGEVAVRERLAKQRGHLLGCLYEPAAEPTNNRAERALRPAVISRKLSCGNKTSRGRRTWEILTSMAATCQQRGANLLDILAPKLTLNVQAR